MFYNKLNNMARLVPSCLLLLIMMLAIISLPNCTSQIDSGSEIIAKIGQRTLNWQEIHRNFNLDPKWGKGLTNRQAYYNQLNFLINRKIFALEALKHSQKINQKLWDYLNSIKEKEMIKELYRRKVSDQVEITEEEYQTGYKWMKQQVQIEFINTPDSLRAVVYLNELKNKPMNQITLKDPDVDEAGTTPMFSYGDMQEKLENVVFQMKQGETGGPLRIHGNFMVFKLIDGRRDTFMSEMDYHEKKSKIRKIIFDRRAAKISDKYVYQLLKDQKITINPDVFFPLADQFSQNIQQKNSAKPFPIHINDRELNLTSANLEQLKNETLVTFNDGVFTLSDFLEYIGNLPVGLRPKVNMAPQLKRAVAVMVRNHQLVEEAKDLGLDKSERVNFEYELQADEVLSRYWLKRIQESITCSSAEIEAFKSKKNFTRVNTMMDGKLDNDAIRDVILDYKFAVRKEHLADSLRNIYAVKIDSVMLQKHVPDPDQIIDFNPIRFVLQEGFN